MLKAKLLRMEDPLEGGYHCRWAYLGSCGADINYGDIFVPAAIPCQTRVGVGQFCQLDCQLATLNRLEWTDARSTSHNMPTS
jgi:hypothetical protein